MCSPYIVGINGQKEIEVKMEYEEIDFWKGHQYYYGIINFSTRGTKKLNKVPPIYLNNTYLGGDCSIENDGYSIKCRIKDTIWYHVNLPKPPKYRVNELYEGCYGAIFTGITLNISGENLTFNLFIILILFTFIF